MPEYRIYYGKYPDELNNQIENTHIRSVSPIKFTIESGKPAEPKIDDASFDLENLNPDGTERYGTSFFENNSRTQAEGAIKPLQIFFKIEMVNLGNKYFLGILDSKSYSSHKEVVTIKIKDPRKILKESKSGVIKSFEFNKSSLLSHFSSASITGQDLEGTSIDQQILWFKALDSKKVPKADPITFDNNYMAHRGFDDLDLPVVSDPPNGEKDTHVLIEGEYRSTFIKIHDITILTFIQERVLYFVETDSNGDTSHYISLDVFVWHANNGNYESDEGIILERGRFFNEDNESYPEGGPVDDTFPIELTFSIIDYNFGNDDDILLNVSDIGYGGPVTPDQIGINDVYFIHGCAVNIDYTAGSPDTYHYNVVNTPDAFYNMLNRIVSIFNNNIFNFFYNTQPPNQFNTSKVLSDQVNCFEADFIHTGWAGASPGEVAVALGTMLNSYIYFDEENNIVFHDRLYHEDYLPGSLPPNSFEVKEEDINPMKYLDGEFGFETYEIEVNDRIEINNVSSDESRKLIVSEDGVKKTPSLRNSKLETPSYRTSDLGVPTMNETVEQLVFRLSPADPNFALLDITNFLPLAETQAQNFAKSWSYPVFIWEIKWDMNKYPLTKIGAYFWVDHGSENSVYFIRELTYNLDGYFYGIVAQKVGTYNG